MVSFKFDKRLFLVLSVVCGVLVMDINCNDSTFDRKKSNVDETSDNITPTSPINSTQLHKDVETTEGLKAEESKTTTFVPSTTSYDDSYSSSINRNNMPISKDTTTDNEISSNDPDIENITTNTPINIGEGNDDGSTTDSISDVQFPNSTATIEVLEASIGTTELTRSAELLDLPTDSTSSSTISSTSSSTFSSTSSSTTSSSTTSSSTTSSSTTAVTTSSSSTTISASASTTSSTSSSTTTTSSNQTISTSSPTSSSTSATSRTTSFPSNITTESSKTTQNLNEPNSDLKSSGFNLNYLYFILLIIPTVLIPVSIVCFYRRRKKKKEKNSIRRESRARSPTASWIFKAASDSEDEDEYL